MAKRRHLSRPLPCRAPSRPPHRCLREGGAPRKEVSHLVPSSSPDTSLSDCAHPASRRLLARTERRVSVLCGTTLSSITALMWSVDEFFVLHFRGACCASAGTASPAPAVRGGLPCSFRILALLRQREEAHADSDFLLRRYVDIRRDKPNTDRMYCIYVCTVLYI